MADYDIGYGKPPKASQFKPGVSGNKKGRPKRQKTDLAGMILRVANTPIRHREDGREQLTAAWELNLKLLVRAAIGGDVDAAAEILKFRIQAERMRSGKQRVVVEDWLPDYLGQTAEQKTQEFARKRNTAATKWWLSTPALKDHDER